jgi:hypothetical protein
VSPRPVPPRRLWWLVAGFGVWCSALVVAYALHAIGCAFGWSAGSLRLVLALAIVAHLIVLGWMWRDRAIDRSEPGFGPTGTFLQTVALWTLIAAVVATVPMLGLTIALATCL